MKTKMFLITLTILLFISGCSEDNNEINSSPSSPLMVDSELGETVINNGKASGKLNYSVVLVNDAINNQITITISLKMLSNGSQVSIEEKVINDQLEANKAKEYEYYFKDLPEGQYSIIINASTKEDEAGNAFGELESVFFTVTKENVTEGWK